MSAHDSTEQLGPSNGLSGTFRLMGILLVLALSALGVLAVLDVINLDALGEVAKKLALLTAIGVATIAAVWALSTSKRG
jgi:hypothetical protein